MASRSCDFCGGVFDDRLLDSGRALIMGEDAYCPDCVEEFGLKKKRSASAPQKKKSGITAKPKRRPTSGGQRKTPLPARKRTRSTGASKTPRTTPSSTGKARRTTRAATLPDIPGERPQSKPAKKKGRTSEASKKPGTSRHTPTKGSSSKRGKRLQTTKVMKGRKTPGGSRTGKADDDKPDMSFGDDLARASGVRKRKTSAYQLPRSAGRRASQRTSRIEDAEFPEETKPTRYILLGVGLLVIGVVAFLALQSDLLVSILPSGTTEKTRTRSDWIEAPDDDWPGEDSDEDKTPTITQQPVDTPDIPEPLAEEHAVLVMRDHEIDADVRMERIAWRLKRGTPSPGEVELILGDYEDTNEILNWTFRPGDGVEAWEGMNGITSNEKSLRLQVEAKTEAYDSTEFFLALPDSKNWKWTGAQELQLDIMNPMKKALDLAIVVRSGSREGEQKKEGEWVVTVPPGFTKHMVCPLGDKVDLEKVWHVGLRIPRKKGRPVLFYIDRFALSGSFR